MYLQKSLLSRLLSAAWTVLLILGLLWLAVQLLAEIWLWLVAVTIPGILIRIGFWVHHWRRDDW